MNLSKNEKVQNFLSELKAVDSGMFDIVFEVRAIIFKSYPTVNEKIMYGGIVFFVDTEMFSGIFTYKHHVTLEFSKGYLMKDPNKRLEGKGKFRRHLKLKNTEDILNQELSFFVKQALA